MVLGRRFIRCSSYILDTMLRKELAESISLKQFQRLWLRIANKNKNKNFRNGKIADFHVD
jgi:hypothetical protein